MNSKYDVIISDSINHNYPGAKIGILALGVSTWKESSQEMTKMTEEVILNLKETYHEPGMLKTNKVIEAYIMYYRKFKKTYHVIPQLDSVIFNDKKIKMGNPLLHAVFTAELKNMLLTAIHDLDTIRFPVTISLASGEENYRLLNGSETLTKSGDMVMTDQSGVISSIIYGPDLRTKVTSQTSNAMIVVYSPEGIGPRIIESHFDDIMEMINLISEDPKVIFREILPGNTPG